ncbi:Fic family protein [Methanomassiliicoccus luminyensis]|uniref:Fic family protein n=1 Tax=Methanomassiliicoccus luminyensis TaxID=1080712 RepID=UPI00036494B4|nr:Fic family protein [Methanomassiliicoccus luminyensis]
MFDKRCWATIFIWHNTLTLKEAHDLLEYGTVPRSKPLREINEVQNFKNVIQYHNKYKGKVTLDFIRTLHSLIMNNIDAESAGTFRRIDDIGIAGCDLRLAPSELITEELQAAINEYYDQLESGVHPFEAAVLFHYKFEIAHPFTDGNGRVRREVFNYLLMREKFPRLLFLGKDREEYLTALKGGNIDDYADMVSTFCDPIMGQRMQILIDNLQKVAVPMETTRRAKGGQMLIEDFLQII